MTTDGAREHLDGHTNGPNELAIGTGFNWRDVEVALASSSTKARISQVHALRNAVLAEGEI